MKYVNPMLKDTSSQHVKGFLPFPVEKYSFSPSEEFDFCLIHAHAGNPFQCIAPNVAKGSSVLPQQLRAVRVVVGCCKHCPLSCKLERLPSPMRFLWGCVGDLDSEKM